MMHLLQHDAEQQQTMMVKWCCADGEGDDDGDGGDVTGSGGGDCGGGDGNDGKDNNGDNEMRTMLM